MRGNKEKHAEESKSPLANQYESGLYVPDHNDTLPQHDHHTSPITRVRSSWVERPDRAEWTDGYNSSSLRSISCVFRRERILIWM